MDIFLRILGWGAWGFVLVFYVLTFAINRLRGERFHAITQAQIGVLALLLVVVPLAGIRPIHMLWLAPIAYMATRGIASRLMLTTTAPVDLMRGALEGKPGIHILVEDMPSGLAGLTAASLARDVEEVARGAGISVLSQKEAFQTSGGPYVSLSATREPDGSHVVTMEWCPLAWKPAAWSQSERLTGTLSNELQVKGHKAVRALAHEFVRAYVKANLGLDV